MVDKLVVLGSEIHESLREVVLQKGRPGMGYHQVIDLRKTESGLPVRFHYAGRWTGVHKADLIDVARLGLPRTIEILEQIFPKLPRLRIYRIDLCVDLLGVSPDYFLVNCRIPRRQNIALFRSRGATSFYPVFSKERKILIYDRLKLLKKQKDSLAEVYRSGDNLTRIEVQYFGKGVPYSRFSDICRYTEFNPFQDLKFQKVQIDTTDSTPSQFLTAVGLRALISKFGLQFVAKRFSPQEWAYLQKRFLNPIAMTELPALRQRVKESTADWLEGRIRFPRSATLEQK